MFNFMKMKKLYTVFAFVIATFWANAQITVTNATFPVAGDTLKYAIDQNPDGVTITSPGGPTNWDFTGLAATLKTETTYQAASGGGAFADFSNAELLTPSAGGQGETYYDVTATSFSTLGFYGVDPTGGGLPIQTAMKFDPPVIERRAPLNFIDNNVEATELNIALPIDSALTALLTQLGVPAGLADSLRVRVSANRVQIVDAYGSLTIPGGTYDVLRQKSTEYRDTHLELHTFFGWIDVTGQAGGTAGLGQDTIVAYNFISNTEKEFIAVVTTGSDGTTPQQVRYKDNGFVSGNNEVAGAQPSVTVSPNPANEEAVFELKNFTSGNYTLYLLDASSRLVFMKNMQPGSQSVQLGAINQGTYFYQILDDKNRVLNTGKLLKIND